MARPRAIASDVRHDGEPFRRAREAEALRSRALKATTSASSAQFPRSRLVARGDYDLGLTDTDDVWIGKSGATIDLIYPDQKSRHAGDPNWRGADPGRAAAGTRALHRVLVGRRRRNSGEGAVEADAGASVPAGGLSKIKTSSRLGKLSDSEASWTR